MDEGEPNLPVMFDEFRGLAHLGIQGGSGWGRRAPYDEGVAPVRRVFGVEFTAPGREGRCSLS